MNEASLPPLYENENTVALFRYHHHPEVYSDRFNSLGSEFIKEARDTARIIIMDECGNLENNATVFQNELLYTLDGATPVLGVIKQSAAGWVDKIRGHPNVTIIPVDKSNRDSLPEALAGMLRSM
jgi:nucleoside-triphosphatase